MATIIDIEKHFAILIGNFRIQQQKRYFFTDLSFSCEIEIRIVEKKTW